MLLTSYNIQSCGLCEGMTKHESNSDCYDNVDNCQELTFNCHKYGKHCKKTCGLCGEETPHPSNTCWDEYRDCPERAKTKCHKVGKNCKRVREGSIFWSSYKYLNTQSCINYHSELRPVSGHDPPPHQRLRGHQHQGLRQARQGQLLPGSHRQGVLPQLRPR